MAQTGRIGGKLKSGYVQFSKILGSTAASYPDVSLSRAKEGGKETTKETTGSSCRLYPSHGPLRLITSRSPLHCEKRSAWGGGWFDRLMINLPFYLGCQQSAEILYQISQIWIACSGTNAQPSTAWS